MADGITFTIDGRDVVAQPGHTILQAALDQEIYIPYLCYYPKMKPEGTCRTCMVEVEVNGVGEVLRISIEPQLIESGDREMIEDLVPAAVNQALAKAKQMHVDAMQELTGGLNVPGLSSALEEMTGSSE